MADTSLVNRLCLPGSTTDRTLRRNRQIARGVMTDTRSNGISSRNRRHFIQVAIARTTSATPMSVVLVRRRLRKCWSLQNAISTAAPTS